MAKSEYNPIHTTIHQARGVRGALTSELGTSGLRRFDGQVNREFLTNLQGSAGVAVYQEMSRNDPIVGAILHAIIQSIRNISWTSYTSDNSNRAQEAQDFVSECFGDMSHTFSDFITESLSMIKYGWSYFEKVYKVRGGKENPENRRSYSKYNDGRVGFRKLAIRSQETLDRWDIGSDGGINGMFQSDWQSDSDKSGQSIYIPIEKAMLFRTVSELNDPEGQSMLRTAYRPWFIKKNLEEIMVIGAERDLVGIPMMVPPENINILDPVHAELRKEAIKILVNVRRDEQEGVLVPAGWTMSLLSSPGQKQFNLLEMLNYYDKRIAITALAQFILLGLDRVGSYALAEEEKDLFEVAQKGWVTSLAEVLNRFGVNDILDLNGWGELENPPQMIPGRLKEPDLNELSQFIVRIVKAGALIPDADLEVLLRKFGGLTPVPPRDASVESAKRGIGNSHTELPSGAATNSIGSGALKEQFRMVDSRGKTTGIPGKAARTVGQEDGSSFVVNRTSRSGSYLFGIADQVVRNGVGSLQEAKQKLYGYLQKNREQYGFIGRELGMDKLGSVVFENIVDYIPNQRVERDDEVYQDWLKARVLNGVAGLERELDRETLDGKFRIVQE